MGNFLYTLFVGALSLSSLAIIIFLIAWYFRRTEQQLDHEKDLNGKT